MLQEQIKGFGLSMELIPDTDLIILHISKAKYEKSVVISTIEAEILTDTFLLPVHEAVEYPLKDGE